MKTTILFILTFIILTSCSVNNNCKNRFDFISSSDSLPILHLDISKDFDSTRQEMNELYRTDLCERCSEVEFKIPFIIENENGFLKIMVDFDSPICGNCPIPMRLRHYFTIMINQNNKLLVEGELIEIDTLQTIIENYLATVGNGDMAPESFKQVNYSIFWNQDSNKNFIDSVLTILYKSHLSFVEGELNKNGKSFCTTDKEELNSLKEKYPLRIEFDLGKIERMKPPDIEKLYDIDSIEINEETDLVEEI